MEGDDKSLFAVCATASVPSTVINAFLKEADAGVKSAAKGLPRLFTLVTTLSSDIDAQQGSWFPLDLPESFVTPFKGKTAREISDLLRQKAKAQAPKLDPDLFVLIDGQSVEDRKVTLCERKGRGKGTVRTVRVSFKDAVSLNTIQVGCTSMMELQSIHGQDDNMDNQELTQESRLRTKNPTSRKSKTQALKRLKTQKDGGSKAAQPNVAWSRQFKNAKGEILMLPGRSDAVKNKIVGSKTFNGDTGEEVEIMEELVTGGSAYGDAKGRAQVGKKRRS